jgi:ribosomal protein L24E
VTNLWRTVAVALAAALLAFSTEAAAARTAPTAPTAQANHVADSAGTPLPFGGATHGGGTTSDVKNPVVAIAAAPGTRGYWIVKSNGNVLPFDGAHFDGAASGKPLSHPVVGMASVPDGRGYWLVASDGGVFAFGNAHFYGSTGGIHLRRPIVGIAATPDGHGYWMVASDGGIFAFGDAHFYGSTGGIHLARPVTGIASTPDGHGYWMVASDGGIFAFGDARFHGSAARDHPLGAIVGMAAAPDGAGYWLASSDGGVYSFGARFYGSLASSQLPNPIVSIAATPSGNGYWLLPTNPPLPPPVVKLPPGFVAGHVTAVGDSVMLDAQPDLTADIPNVDVNAVVSRQWDTGVALVQQLRAEDSLGATIVVDLGTNGPVDSAQFQAMMSALSGATLVVFVTVHLPSSYSWWQSVNETLEAGVPHYADARIADFNALADQNPQWLGSDGVHMPIGGTGAQAMASLITSTIRAAEGHVP